MLQNIYFYFIKLFLCYCEQICSI